MTVIPSREVSVLKTVLSILNGTIVPDAIYCNIPKKYVRFEKSLDRTLITKLEDLGVTVIELEEDRACLNKILPILKYENDPETLVATMDDDMTYTPLWLEGLVKGHQQFGGVVGYSGILYPERVIEMTGTLRYSVIYGHGNKTDILENGFGTIFKLECIFGFPEIPGMTQDNKDSPIYLSDDCLLGIFYDSKDIKKTVVCFPEIGRNGDDWSSMCKVNDEGCCYAIFSSEKEDEEAFPYPCIGSVNSLKRYIKAARVFRKILYLKNILH